MSNTYQTERGWVYVDGDLQITAATKERLDSVCKSLKLVQELVSFERNTQDEEIVTKKSKKKTKEVKE